MISLVIFQLFLGWFFPFFLVPLRTAADNEVMGDKMFSMFKAIVPMGATGTSFIFNSEVLKQLDVYRTFNEAGKGGDIVVDEYDSLNGGADITWTILHAFIFWFILLAVIEYRLPCFCCDTRPKQVTYEDNETFFGTAGGYKKQTTMSNSQQDAEELEDEEGDSSEVAQIVEAANQKL